MKRSLIAFLLAFWLAAGVGCAPNENPPTTLPQSVYFLAGEKANFQIWRLEKDGRTTAQITQQPGGITDFAVSLSDGSLAFISNGCLYLWQADQPAPRLLVDPSLTPPTPEYEFPLKVGTPVFSPDGRILAYSLDGIHLYHLGSGDDQFLLPSPGNLLGEPFVFVKEYYSPGPWSPDGKGMLIVMGYYEGDTLAIYEPGTEEPFRRIWSNGAVCCTYQWSADSQTVLVGNPYFTTQPPGLWEYDAQTGLETILLDGIREDGTWVFAGWPFRTTTGEISYFSAEVESLQDTIFANEPIIFNLVQEDSAGGGPQLIQPGGFRISDVLWSPDGSLALILQLTDQDRQLVLARTDGSPPQVLQEGLSIHNITWGP